MTEKKSSSNFDDLEGAYELNALKDHIKKLELENTKLKLTLQDYGIEESELLDITDEEAICVKQIQNFRELSDKGVPFDQDMAKTFDILHKNLRMARGEGRGKKTPKGKPKSVSELLKIVDETKSN